MPMLKKQKMQKVAGEKKTKGRGRGRGKGRGKGGKGRGNGKKPNAKDEESEQKPEEKDNNVRRVEEDQKHEGSVKQVEVQAETSEEHQAEHSEKTEEEIPCPRSTPRVLRRTKSKRRMLLKKANSMSPKGKKKSQENETKKKAEPPEKEAEELNNPRENPKPAKKKVSKKQRSSTDIPKEAEANAAPNKEEAEAEPAKAEQDGHDLTPEEEAEKRDEERKRAELAKKKAVLEAHSFIYQRTIVQSDQDHKAYTCVRSVQSYGSVGVLNNVFLSFLFNPITTYLERPHFRMSNPCLIWVLSLPAYTLQVCFIPSVNNAHFEKRNLTGRMAWLFQARDANYSLLAEVADDKLCLPSLEQLGAAKQLPQRTFVVLC